MGWWGSLLRALGLDSKPVDVPIGGAGATSGTPIGPGYSPRSSVSSFAVFPWVRACVDAYSNDLGSLPLVIQRGQGPQAVRVEGGPVAALLEQPTSWQDRAAWESSLTLYLLLSGSAWCVLAGGNRPSSLPLLHPEGVRVIPGDLGEPVGIEWRTQGGTTDRYAIDALVSWQLTAWEYGTQGLLGEGLIRALATDLEADRQASKLAAKAASRGRPDAVISPKGDDVIWDPETRKAVAAGYAALAAGGSSVMVNGGATDVKFPNYTPRDLEFGAQKALTRETVLAAFGVPPARLGLPNTNYATANASMLMYWDNVRALARRIDAGLTRVARRFDPRLSVHHDFSGVSVLQEARTARLDRVSVWVTLGADGAAAAEYEGFTDSPLMPKAPAEQPRSKAVNDSDWFPTERPALRLVNDGYEEPAPAPEAPTEEQLRAARWRGWLDEVHTPAERRIATAARRTLREQAARVAGRVPALTETDAQARNLTGVLADALLDAIFPPAEEAVLVSQGMAASIEETIGIAMRRAARQVGVEISVSRVQGLANARLSSLVTNTTETTRDALRVLCEDALRQGLTTAELQTAIQQAAAFAPSRALLIGRTEATAGTNEASLTAWRDAEIAGVSVRKAWLSARDGEVRDEHALLDGQVRHVGELFTVPLAPGLAYAGEQGSGPGSFPSAGMVCNCRCTVEPVLEDS